MSLTWTCAGCDKTITSLYSKVTVAIGSETVVVCSAANTTDSVPRKSCAQKAFLKILWGNCAICGKATPGKGFRSRVPDTLCLECRKNAEGYSKVELLRGEIQGLRSQVEALRAEQKLTYLEHGLLSDLWRKLRGLLGEKHGDAILRNLALATTGRFVPETERSPIPYIDEQRAEATQELVRAWLGSLEAAGKAGREQGRSFLLDLAQGTFEIDQLDGTKKR